MFKKLKSYLVSDEEEIEMESTQIFIIEPRSFNDAEIVGNKLKHGIAVVVNMKRLTKLDAQRTIDFISGVLFTLNGEIHEIGEEAYLLSPTNVSVDGIIEELKKVEY